MELNAERHLYDEAFWVMLLGMGIVFAFLSLLVLLLYANQRLLRRWQPVSPSSPSGPSSPPDPSPALAVAIAAAVHRFRRGK